MSQVILSAVTLVLSFGTCSLAQNAAEPPSTNPSGGTSAESKNEPAILCPVTGLPIDRTLATRFHNRWVYCANKDALRKFEADPLAYADKLQPQWDADPPIRVQVKCPVTGDPPGEYYVGLGENAVFFAAADAKQKWLEDPKKFEQKLPDCYSYQTGCGSCGMLINPKVKRQIDDRAVFFCCDGCAQAFAKDKDTHLKRV